MTGAAAATGGAYGKTFNTSRSANFANISGTSPQSNADVTLTFAKAGTITVRATLSAGTYGAGTKSFIVVKNGVDGNFISPSDGGFVEATVSSGDTLHYRATKAGSGTQWNATVTVSRVDGSGNVLQSLGSFTASVSVP